jgi:hypothetical protein
MKKIVLLVVCLFVLLTQPAWADITAHPNYQEIRSMVTIMSSIITGRQTAYFAQHGAYFQGCKIPSQIECNGSTSVAVDYGLHPDDQTDSWGTWLPNVFNDTLRVPFNIQIDTMALGANHGYIITFTLMRNGLGPDKYGNTGNIWYYICYEGDIMGGGVEDDWFVGSSGI